MSEPICPEPEEQDRPITQHGLTSPKTAKPLVDHRPGIDPFFKGRGYMPDSRLLEPFAHVVMTQTRRDRLGKDGQFVDDGDAIFKRAVNKGVRAYGPTHSERRTFAGVGCGSYSNRARKGLLTSVDFKELPTYSELVEQSGYQSREAAKDAKRAAKSRAYWGRR